MSVAMSTTNFNRVSGWSHDATGNVTSDTVNTYAWNAESEMTSADGVNYTYDGDGNRLEKSSGKMYWYGAGTEILDESDTSGNVSAEYVFFGGKRIAMDTIAGTGGGSISSTYYYLEDSLGSSRVMVQAGATSACFDADFYPFGGERDVVSTCNPVYKFEGKERDTESGNDDFGARYYTWRFGRWLSADWSAIPAPVPYANLTNPQTLNLYAMVSDNPETFADLDGHQSACLPEFAGTCSDKANAEDYHNQTADGKPCQDSSGQVDCVTKNQGSTGAVGLLRDWLDVIEVNGSYGFGASVSGQAGYAEGRAAAGEETEGTTGLGFNNGEATVFIGAQASAKAGAAEAEVKAGVTMSTRDGASLSAEAQGKAGPAGGGVTIDKSGVRTHLASWHDTDSKIGAHVQVGVGVGVNINLTQASRAYNETVSSLHALGMTLYRKFAPEGLPGGPN